MKWTVSMVGRHLILLGIAFATLACGVGDEFVTGVGNSGNRFYASPVVDELAEELARNEAIPLVTDEMLRASFVAIAKRAAEGDPESSLILFRLAQEQRERDAE